MEKSKLKGTPSPKRIVGQLVVGSQLLCTSINPESSQHYDASNAKVRQTA